MKFDMVIMPLEVFQTWYFPSPCYQQYQHGGNAITWGGNSTSIIQCRSSN